MTTLVSPDGAPEVINARRTESLDAPSILKLVQPATEALFGRVNVVNVIEKAVLAVTLVNEREELLGHAAFFDYPNVSNVDQGEWEQWLNRYYDCSKCTSLNTLFMHYFVAKPEYSHGCAKEIIRTLFNAATDIHHCFLVVPTGVFPDSALAEVFKQMPRLEGVKSSDGSIVFSCYRHEHVPVLHVRAAKVEDNDDLVPIFTRQSGALKETYGEYFLAELIEAQDDTMKCIVGEVDGTAIGFMSLSTDINIDILNECYELGPFHGLRRPHEEDELDPPKTPTPAPSPQPVAAEQRPASARSQKSIGSQGSRQSVGSQPGSGKKSSSKSQAESQEQTRPSSSKSNTSSKQGSRQGSKQGSRPGSKESQREAQLRSKLSDAELMADGQAGGLLSDHSDVESIKSAASERDIAQDQAADPTQPCQTALAPKTPKPEPPQAKLPKRFVPMYKGECNAVCVQLFCIDESYEMRSGDFLSKAFELFPECEFCIITVPHLVPEFPLLQQFVRVTPRCPSTLSQELYIFGRAGLLRSFNVRQAGSADFDGVSALVQTLDLHDNLLADLTQYNKARRDQDGTNVQAYVAECNKKVVGVAIVRKEEEIENIRSHYNIEDFIYFNHHKRTDHAHLHHFALNPIFKHHSKHFLKEILRLGNRTCLYYPLYPPYVDKTIVEGHSLVTCLNDLVPVRARRQIVYPLNSLGENAPSKRILAKPELYALNHINRKLVLEPKVTINARIVVVGASDTGIAFLESFAFCPHLRFNNLTLISPHGLPGELPPDELRDQMMASSLCYNQEDYVQMALRAWVNVVYGTMTAINRKKKHVVVNGGTIVPYDHLILTTGTMYQVPAPTEADIGKLLTSSEVPNSPDRPFTGVPPKNAFTINDSYDAAVALYWIENNLLSSQGKALVYGSSLDAYCCVQTLLAMGVPGERIYLVEPPHNYETTCFNNPDVERAVGVALQEAGVEMYSGYLLAQWNDGQECEQITSASFTSNAKPLKLECCAFFCYYKRTVDRQAFKAINDACLVYDGRLVIDANFHTNDVTIRAAGPVTKFQRSYHADQWTHANFNSKEVGYQLASVMLQLFDPTLEQEQEPPEDMLKLIPMFRCPKTYKAVLPGSYNYLHVGKPSLNTPLEALMAQGDYGRELITGKPGAEIEFFRLHINQYNILETITCLAKQAFPAANVTSLFGLHERYLNNLLSRFDENLISDFYSYFQETWCLALFHDRFPDFRDEVRELLITRPSADVPALEEKIRQMIDEDLVLNKTQRKALSEEYQMSGARRAVETRMLSFLSYNYYHLPMYAKPGMV